MSPTRGIPWDDPNSDPVGDLLDFVAVCERVRPGTILVLTRPCQVKTCALCPDPKGCACACHDRRDRDDRRSRR